MDDLTLLTGVDARVFHSWPAWTVALHTLSANLYAQGLALAAAISAPSVAVMLAIRSVRSGAAAKWKSGLAYGLWQLLKTAAFHCLARCT